MGSADGGRPDPGDGASTPVPEEGTFTLPDGRVIPFGPRLGRVLSLREVGLVPYFDKPGPAEQALTAGEPPATETVPHVIGDGTVHIERHGVPVSMVKLVPADSPHTANPN
jgi:hypothetical protein